MRTLLPRLASLFVAAVLLLASCSNPEKDYQQAVQANTEQAFLSFLEQHPRSPLAERARAKMEEISYQNADQANTEQAFRSFLEKHPKSSLADKARARRDELAFQNAERAGTEQAFQDLLKRYPQGPLSAKAQARLEEISFQNAERANTEEAFLLFLKQYAKSSLANRAQAKIEELRTAYLCVQHMTLRQKPAFDATGNADTGNVSFGTKLAVMERNGDWIRIAPVGDSQGGWIHRALVTAHHETTVQMARTGLIPNSIFVFYATEGKKELTVAILGSDIDASLGMPKDTTKKSSSASPGESAASGTTLSEVRIFAGDSFWFSDVPQVHEMNEYPLKSFGVSRPLVAPKPGILYVYDGAQSCLPLSEILEKEMKTADAQPLPGILAWRCPGSVCSAPRDLFWSSGLGGFVVADAEQGVLILQLDPLRGIRRSATIARQGQQASLVGLGDQKLCTLWSGSRNELVMYEPEAPGTFTAGMAVALPSEPTAFQPKPGKEPIAFVGCKGGNLLVIDLKQGRVLADTRIAEGPVWQLDIQKDKLWAACGAQGMVAIDIAKPDHPLVIASTTAAVPARAFLRAHANEKGIVFIADGDGAMRVAPAEQADPKSMSLLKGSENLPISCIAVGEAPEDSFVMRSTNPPAVLLASAGTRGLGVFAGPDNAHLELLRLLPVPCAKVCWGTQHVACASPDSLWFVSPSEILPAEYSGSIVSIHGGAQLGFEGGNLVLVAAEGHGVYGCKVIFPFAKAKGWSSDYVARKGVTIMQQRNSFLVIGDISLRKSDTIYFQPGVSVAIGKGGVTLGDRKYATGEILKIEKDGSTYVAGRWRGFWPQPE